MEFAKRECGAENGAGMALARKMQAQVAVPSAVAVPGVSEKAGSLAPMFPLVMQT